AHIQGVAASASKCHGILRAGCNRGSGRAGSGPRTASFAQRAEGERRPSNGRSRAKRGPPRGMDELDYSPVLQGKSRRVIQPTPHRSARWLPRALAVLFAAAATACGGSPTGSETAPEAGPSDFSGALAWAELEELADDPRPLGSDGAEAAR